MASADDDVQLPDLQVIQRYSLAVKGAAAPRADVIAALEADLAWLTGGARRRPAPPAAERAPARTTPVRPAAAATAEPAVPVAPLKKTPAKKAAANRAPAKKVAAKAPVRKAAKKASAKSGTRRR